MTADAISMIQMQTNSIHNRALHSQLILVIELELFFSDSQALLYTLMVSALRHFVTITLFIACRDGTLNNQSN